MTEDIAPWAKGHAHAPGLGPAPECARTLRACAAWPATNHGHDAYSMERKVWSMGGMCCMCYTGMSYVLWHILRPMTHNRMCGIRSEFFRLDFNR